MLRKWIGRLLVGVAIALPLMLFTYALARAASLGQVQPAEELDCAVCHTAFQEAWENGAHGRATSDPAFRKVWNDRGQPQECLGCHTTGYDMETGTWKADGITCQACHNPVPANHPLEPMGVDRSPQLCGKCHAETYFEWQVSVHRQKGLDCAGCHDPHGTTLKAESSEMLCATCHRARAANYTHSAHSQQGLSCDQCHLAPLTNQAQEGHAGRDHSFFVSLTTCNSCHAYQMHDPVQVHPDQPTPQPVDAEIPTLDTLSVSDQPMPVSPAGYAALAGMLGIAFGVIIAPWLEKQRRPPHPDNDPSGDDHEH